MREHVLSWLIQFTEVCQCLRKYTKKAIAKQVQKKKRSSLNFSPIFRPKLGEEQKQTRSLLKFSPIFCPKVGEEQKKTRSSLKFPPILSPNEGASLEETQRTYSLCDQTLCLTCKGGGGGYMPQFCILFYAIIRS